MSGRSMSSIAQASPILATGYGNHHPGNKERQSCFQMPLHYPRYKRANYEKMPEWKLNCLFTEYGIPVSGDLNYKREYAMGAFLRH